MMYALRLLFKKDWPKKSRTLSVHTTATVRATSLCGFPAQNASENYKASHDLQQR